MMASLIKNLTVKQQKELFPQLNYLNISEYQNFCKKHQILFHIYIELPNGKLKKTSDKDRKGIVLSRIKKYLLTGKIPKSTIIKKHVIQLTNDQQGLTPNDQLYYGQYNTKNKSWLDLLKNLTDGKFKDGAIAREVIREFWTKGKAPTYAEFAKAWLIACKKHSRPNPEWAYLTDKANGFKNIDWKNYRKLQAQKALRTLNSIKLNPNSR